MTMGERTVSQRTSKTFSHHALKEKRGLGSINTSPCNNEPCSNIPKKNRIHDGRVTELIRLRGLPGVRFAPVLNGTRYSQFLLEPDTASSKWNQTA